MVDVKICAIPGNIDLDRLGYQAQRGYVVTEFFAQHLRIVHPKLVHRDLLPGLGLNELHHQREQALKVPRKIMVQH